MPNNEDWIKEFDEIIQPKIVRFGQNTRFSSDKLGTDIKSFILKLKSRWVEEERERLQETTKVSWDIADGGKDWIVQFWKIKKDGTHELFTQLDKNSDDGGNFTLTTPNKDI